MTSRPEILFPLHRSLTTLEGIGPSIEKKMKGLLIDKPVDLLFTLPISFIKRKLVETVFMCPSGQYVIVEVSILKHQPGRTKQSAYKVIVQDKEVSFNLLFFHARKDYLNKILPIGEKRIISGKLELFDGFQQIVHPDYIIQMSEKAQIKSFQAIYPLTAGITQKIMRRSLNSVFQLLPDLEEWIDPSLKESRSWPGWNLALKLVHDPTSHEAFETSFPARERLSYDELYAHQLTLAIARLNNRKKAGRPTLGTGDLEASVLTELGFDLTKSQKSSIKDIKQDLAKPFRMNRLLQGDVGSGKTVVAFVSLLVAIEAGGQGVLMAPTEILVQQHVENLRPLGDKVGVVVESLTGRDKGKEREKKLKALRDGNIHILIGTHAVFQSGVNFLDLRLAIIDEQHRFGVRQRLALGEKGQNVDVLVMTATPIPRSLALSQYGEMDLTVLREKPAGRKPVKTVIVSDNRVHEIAAKLKEAINRNIQAYWVCPLIEESELLDYTAAEERFKALRTDLGEGLVGLVHGQMSSEEKDDVMKKFSHGQIKVLVSTTVIEVGVDVPRASIIVIERAEKFGLAQLHQLRGRVGRGSSESSCILLYKAPLSENGERRLSILRETEDGFKIAEIDLQMRGAGDMIGTAQSGLPRFRIADIYNQEKLLNIAHKYARVLLEKDPTLRLTKEGNASRKLLWLMGQEQAFRLLSVG